MTVKTAALAERQIEVAAALAERQTGVTAAVPARAPRVTNRKQFAFVAILAVVEAAWVILLVELARLVV